MKKSKGKKQKGKKNKNYMGNSCSKNLEVQETNNNMKHLLKITQKKILVNYVNY